MNVDRCASCAAVLRPGAQWCGLCFTPIGQEPEPDRTPSALVRVAEHDSDTLTLAPTTAPPPPPPAPRAVHGWPCTACKALNDFSVSRCTGCGAAFLATSRPGLVLPVIGDLSKLSAPQRMLLALAASPVLAVVLVLLVGLVGLVL